MSIALPMPPERDGWPRIPVSTASQPAALRWLCDDDLPWLRALYASTREAELVGVPWPAGMRDTFLDQQFAAQHLHYVSAFADADFLAVCDGVTPLGRLYLRCTPPLHLLIDISLFPHARGRGLGATLIAVVQDHARMQACGVELHVLQSNSSAQRLYRRHGFDVVATEAPYVRMTWSPERLPTPQGVN